MFGNESSYSTFTMEKLIVGVSGEYNDMVSKPYIMHVAQNSLDEFMLNTQNGVNITQQSVQLENQNIIQVQAEHQGIIEIDGGWHTGRNVFVMVLRNVNDNSKFVLSGFTSSDFMMGNQVNQYASLTFNSVIELQAVQDYNGNIRYELYNSDNILSMTSLTGTVSGQQISSPQRPQDVLNNAILRGQVLQGNGDLENNVPVVNLGMADAMGMGSRSPELSRATNGAATDYLYRTTRAFSDARLIGTSVDGAEEHMAGALGSAIISEGSYQEMPLINTILSHAGARRSASATIEELQQIMPNLPQVIEIIRGDSGAVLSNTEHWMGRNEAIIASELAAAVPAIMLKLGIQIAGIEMSTSVNYASMDGMPNTFNYKLNPHDPSQPLLGFIIPEIPGQQVAAAFEAYMRNVVFPSCCRGRNVVASIECSITKDLILSISVDGNNAVNFVAPTFASSAWSPVSSTSLQSNTSMANGMLELTSVLLNMQEGLVDVSRSNQPPFTPDNTPSNDLF